MKPEGLLIGRRHHLYLRSIRVATVIGRPVKPEGLLVGRRHHLHQCQGQYYDGASNMRGRRIGASPQILSEEKHALYIHCYGHVLNLAVAMLWSNARFVVAL